jgi:hypothetical protein
VADRLAVPTIAGEVARAEACDGTFGINVNIDVFRSPRGRSDGEITGLTPTVRRRRHRRSRSARHRR